MVYADVNTSRSYTTPAPLDSHGDKLVAILFCCSGLVVTGYSTVPAYIPVSPTAGYATLLPSSKIISLTRRPYSISRISMPYR